MAKKENSGKKPRKYLVTQVNQVGDEIGYVATLHAARNINLIREIIKTFNLADFVLDYMPDVNRDYFKQWLAIPEAEYDSKKSETYKGLESKLKNTNNGRVDIGTDAFHGSPYIEDRYLLIFFADEAGDNDLFFIADKMRTEEEVKKIMKKRA